MRCRLCGHDLDGFLGGHYSDCPARQQVEATHEQNRLLEEQRETQEAAKQETRRLRDQIRERNDLLEEASDRTVRQRLDQRARERRADREAEADARREKDVARQLHELGLEHRRLLRTIKTAPSDALLAALSLVERVRMIEPADVDPAQREALTDLMANGEDASAAASQAAGVDATPLTQWFSLELERFLLVAAALRQAAGDRNGDLAARNPSDKSLEELRAEGAPIAERHSGLATAVLSMCPADPPAFLTALASEDSSTFTPSARLTLTQLKRELAQGSVSIEFVEALHKEVGIGLAAATRTPETVLGPRPKMFGRASWDEQHAKWLVQQQSDACETLGKYRVLRVAGDALQGQAESVQRGVEALDAVFAFDRDRARGGARADLEGRFDRLSDVMWREVTKVRPQAERREDFEEFAASAEDDEDELDEAVGAFAKELGTRSDDDSDDMFDEEDD